MRLTDAEVREPSAILRQVGLVEWFRPGEYERVERVLADLDVLGVTHLRTAISWADWCTPQGSEWYDWLIPRVGEDVTLLPCFHYTPPSIAVEPKTSAPPRAPSAYADFVELMIGRFDGHFEWVELWNEPNNPSDWDDRLDPDWQIFTEMIRGAAARARTLGKKTVLGGMCPIDPRWLELMCRAGALADIDAIGLHGFPGTWDFDWTEWPESVAQVRRVLEAHQISAQIWITEAGYSTWRHNERGQIRAFVKAVDAPVERVYWTAVHDLDPHVPHRDGLHADERHYHLGLRKADGTPKLLLRLWSSGGWSAVRSAAWLSESVIGRRETRPILITGGAGFVGCNLADRLLRDGERVLIFDNLSRPGVEENLYWLKTQHGDRLQVEVADVRDRYAVTRAVQSARQIFHLAAQVAVTTSLVDAPRDFDINAGGTLNVLEAARQAAVPPSIVFTSTNKVYGALPDVRLSETRTRYEPDDPYLLARGLDEDRPLDFHSPYGCSKGAADQYMIDYARTFDIPTVVFRMSCIYGPHQFGTEDQGWVAHFIIKALLEEPLTIYGDGKQVRDILFVDDLVEAMLLAQRHVDALSGQAFNIGGGPENTISLLDLIALLQELHGRRVPAQRRDWRPGDQRYYVSDTTRFRDATGWQPRVAVREGVARLFAWLCASRTIPGGVTTGKLAS